MPGRTPEIASSQPPQRTLGKPDTEKFTPPQDSNYRQIDLRRPENAQAVAILVIAEARRRR